MAEYHEKIIRNARYLDGITTYYVDILCDTAADIPNPAEHPEWEIGSELVVLENGGSKYQLSNAREWVAVNFNSGGGGENSGSSKNKLPPFVERTLTEITAEDLEGATSIAQYTFYRYKTLKSISLPNGVTDIGGDAFTQCEGLETIVFPESLKTIGATSFDQCINLTSLTIPASVEIIDGFAFSNCTGLTTVTFEGTPRQIGQPASQYVTPAAFAYCTNLKTINVPWAEGAVANAPWGATNATINYNYKG